MRLHQKQDAEISALVKIVKILNALPEAALLRVADHVHAWAHNRLPAEKGGVNEGKEGAGEAR